MTVQTTFIPGHGMWHAFDPMRPGVNGFGKTEDAAIKSYNVELTYFVSTPEEVIDNPFDDEESADYFNRYIAGDR